MFDMAIQVWSDFNDRMKATIEEMMVEVLSHTGSSGPDKAGGYFRLTVPEKNCCLLGPMLIGNPDEEEERLFFGLSQEKATRLGFNHTRLGHLSSHQSRDSSKDKYGGAIIIYDQKNCPYILSFSGLSEHEDEAIMLLVAMNIECLTELEAIGIANLSGNDVFLGLIRADNEEEMSVHDLPTGLELAEDFSDVLLKETCNQMASMNHEEALNFAANALLNRVPDPDAYMKEKGFML